MSNSRTSRSRRSDGEVQKPHILVGVTSAQTCLVLPARLRALRDGGFKVSFVSSAGELSIEVNQLAEVTSYIVPMKRGISLPSDTIAFCRIVLLVARLKPDIVEFSTPKAGLLGSAASWICRVRVRIYFLRGLRLETVTGAKRYVLLWSERIAAACAHVVVVNSESLRNRSRELGVSSEKKLTLFGEGSSNGVDTRRFSPGPSEGRERLRIPAGARVIGFVGRLTGDKGLPELVEAFAKVLRKRPECYLLLVGWFDAAEDALGLELRSRIEGHPRIVCTGYVADPAPYYHLMDVMVLPSWREGFPNAVLEAAASGVPVVATTCTGSCDAVVPEVTGILVPPGYTAAIAEALLRLICDDQLRRRMGEAARRWAVEHFDQRRVLETMVGYYLRLLSRKNKKLTGVGEPVTGVSG
jgi:glycosyltransferase involved in cell wall biosynthesis